jgi:hypothetical protein
MTAAELAKLPKAYSLKQVNRAIQKRFPLVRLIRGNGYYYIVSDDEDMQLKICSLYTTSIGVYSVKHQAVQTWVNDVEALLKDECAPAGHTPTPII